MVICDCCGLNFDDTEFNYKESDEGCYCVCPACGSDDHTPAFYCKVCEKWEPINIEDDVNGVCQSVSMKLFEKYTDLMNASFSADEREIIAETVYQNGDSIQEDL